MNRTLACCIALSIATFACKSRTFNTDATNKNLAMPKETGVDGVVVNQQAVVFNWSRNGGSLEQHLRSQAGEAPRQNREIRTQEELPKEGVRGFGLYTIEDPLASMAYGVDLSCLVVKTPFTLTTSTKRNELKIFERIRGSADVLAYQWGSLPLDEDPFKSAWSAVIRNTNVVDKKRSSKISLANPGMGRGLPATKLAEGRRALQEGNLCRALAVYENEYASFIHSLLAAAFKTAEFEKTSRFPVLLLVSGPPSNEKRVEQPMVQESVRAVAANSSLIQDLSAANVISVVTNNPQTYETGIALRIKLTLVEAVGMFDNSFADDPKNDAKQIELLRRLFVEAKIIRADTPVNSAESFQKAIFRGLADRIANWKANHGEEVLFMTELRQQLTKVNLENALTSIGI
jgi:hypothetical protein